MKRSPIKPRAWVPKPCKTYEKFVPTPRARAVAVSDGKARMVVQVPKGIKARPGKAAPTVEERAWLDFIVAHGCIACRLDGHGLVPPAVHHILRGGRRMGHLFTLPLCDPGHHQGGDERGFISRHPWKKRFERHFGAEADLLALVRLQYAALVSTRRDSTPDQVLTT